MTARTAANHDIDGIEAGSAARLERGRHQSLTLDSMRIHIATDHAGLDFSKHLQEYLTAQGHDVVDHGPATFDPVDDYPPFCISAARGMMADQERGIEALGVIFGGSGNGEQMAANKVGGVRAALVWNLETAVLARQHNDANVISIGARQHTIEEATALIEAFIAEPFSGDERHKRRIAQIAEFEQTGAIAGHEWA